MGNNTSTKNRETPMVGTYAVRHGSDNPVFSSPCSQEEFEQYVVPVAHAFPPDENELESPTVDVLELKVAQSKVDELKTFQQTRRWSLGDKQYWLEKCAGEDFLLGRIDARKTEPRNESIRVTEVVPSNSSLHDDEDDLWKMPLSEFTSKKHGPDKESKRRIRSYYKAQDELIQTFEAMRKQTDHDIVINEESVENVQKKALFYARLSFGVNFALMVAKAVASGMSGSISIISSLVDSVVDLLSGVIIWWAYRATAKRDPYAYPQGRTKLEPVAIVILSVIMAATSIQIIRESIQQIINLTTSSTGLPVVEAPTFAIAGSTIVLKVIMWILCRRVKSSSAQALSTDHRNDVCSNTVAIVCGYIGSSDMLRNTGIRGLSFVDPVGAILISLYILYNWWKTGAEQTRLLTGFTAQPEFLSKITWICVNHHKKIQHIDTVRAFHFGNNFLVEVDIVLPATMTMREAHNIGEPLQLKLEELPEVERAFVHLDYEFTHNPKSEHKTV